MFLTELIKTHPPPTSSSHREGSQIRASSCRHLRGYRAMLRAGRFASFACGVGILVVPFRGQTCRFWNFADAPYQTAAWQAPTRRPTTLTSEGSNQPPGGDHVAAAAAGGAAAAAAVDPAVLDGCRGLRGPSTSPARLRRRRHHPYDLRRQRDREMGGRARRRRARTEPSDIRRDTPDAMRGS